MANVRMSTSDHGPDLPYWLAITASYAFDLCTPRYKRAMWWIAWQWIRVWYRLRGVNLNGKAKDNG